MVNHDSCQIINGTLYRSSLVAYSEGRHVQPMQGKLNLNVELCAEEGVEPEPF